MKKLSAILLLLYLLTACALQPGIGQIVSTSVPESAQSAPASSSVLETENQALLSFESLTVPVTLHKSIDVENLVLRAYEFSFTYTVGAQHGQATIKPGYAREKADWKELQSLSFEFELIDGTAQLTAKWQLDDTLQQDTFVLDEASNLWVYLWDDVELYPLLITEEQAGRLFPDKEISDYTLATLVCFEPMYDVSFYIAGDIPETSYENELLAHFDVYNSASFLWQTDIMYKNHLTVQYTNVQNEQIIFRYNVNRSLLADGTVVVRLDEPDWE